MGILSGKDQSLPLQLAAKERLVHHTKVYRQFLLAP